MPILVTKSIMEEKSLSTKYVTKLKLSCLDRNKPQQLGNSYLHFFIFLSKFKAFELDKGIKTASEVWHFNKQQKGIRTAKDDDLILTTITQNRVNKICPLLLRMEFDHFKANKTLFYVSELSSLLHCQMVYQL